MTAATVQKGLNEACAALRGFVGQYPHDKALPAVEELARRIGQSAKVTRAVLRELDADGDITVPRRGAGRRLRLNEAHPKDKAFVGEIRDGILSGRYRTGTPLPVGLLAHRHGLGTRRMARVCRPLLADGLLVSRAEPGGPRLHVAPWVPGVYGSAGLIEDYCVLGDQRGAALVRSDGSIDWLCLRRFDSAAVFARLLGTAEHGFWKLAPATRPDDVSAPVSVRRYVGDTMVLGTEWTTESGVVTVTDFMVPGDQVPQVVRIVTGVQGQVTMRSLLRARPDYGRTVPRLQHVDERRLAIDLGEDGDGSLWLDATEPVQADGGDIQADFTIVEGERASFVLSWREDADSPPPQPAPDAQLKHTLDHWTAWVARCTYTGPDRPTVVRSLLTLASLIYSPTGAIVAAPTASLPEELGGIRNWDYRYAWLRDGAFIASVLARCGYLSEALAWKDWMVRACAGTPGRRQIMYGIGGEPDLPEKVLSWLPGYEGSSPVRVGNGAAGQLQIDVYGEVADTLCEIALASPDEAPGIAALVVELVTELETLWDQPDMGIWEIRGPRRRFTHSAIMAWVSVDRAVRLIELGYATGPLERWKVLRETIHREVCENGYDAERNTFTQYYGGSALDASLLHAMLCGFLPAEDKRLIGTVEAVQNELGAAGGLLLRYRTEGQHGGVDGLSGDEGHFLICTGWLAETLERIGRHEEAAAVRDRLLSLRSDVGLLAEEYDPSTGRHLGNFPQGFSHLALLRAVLETGPVSAGREHVAALPAGLSS
ncbi:glycoside hydrolase family 15 protein [Streptomyces decoyicus]|uniref:glycoside hydrolase family 15 protein n=1 Tax=Streptomyces decoyicus TaxID=249567 RepID=UPI0036491282